jgi:hypothetical protein
MTDREPIEGCIRIEDPPDEAVVVIRGGPIAAEKIVEHARRQAREYSYRDAPMFSISVSLTVGSWDVSALLAGPLASRSTFAVSTAGSVRGAGFVLLPTYEAPHYDLLLADGEYREAEALLSLFGSPEPNPFKRRGR